MTEIIVSVLTSIGLSGLIAFLARNWLIERLRLSIKYEYDEKLEKLKAQLVAENNAAIERQKAQSARELEQFKNTLQREIEEYKVVANSKDGGYAIVWVALDQLVSWCTGLHARYIEPLDESDEPTLEGCTLAYTKAKRVLPQVALKIGERLTQPIEEFLENYRSELEAFQACIQIKKIRSGMIPATGYDDEYDFELARRSTRNSIIGLQESWRKLKEELREVLTSEMSNIAVEGTLRDKAAQRPSP